MKALIKVGYSCNDHCGFCHTLEVRHIDGSAAEVHTKIERAKELGHSMVVLSGGEPTIRPELVEWATHVASLDMDFGLVTNGRMLAYPELVEELIALRLKYVYLSLHGGSARVHDLMVRSKAFAETYGALANLSGRGIDLHINCVITKRNVDHLRELVDSVLAYPDATVKFSMVEPKGGGDALFASLMPRVSDVAEKVAAAIRYGDERAEGRGPRFVHGGLPFCLLPGLEDRFDDLKTHHYWTMIEVGEPDFFPVDDRNKLQPEACAGCQLRGACPGLYHGYFEAFGAEEITAVQGGARSNSFNYRLERVVEVDAESCALRDGPLGVTPWDRGRHLMVRNGTKLGIYRAETRDFSDAETAAIKHDHGQVYLDATRGQAPLHDFSRDLVQLGRSELCDTCEHRQPCTGLFEPVYEDVFGRDDAYVRELLSEARGDVLDVGCGEGPYENVLGELAAQGAIRYVGVDPDQRAIATLRDRWPWAELHVATAEDLELTRTFDHIFVLRSWNHIADPSSALAQLRRLLKPEGKLTVVDNIAFGLARTARQGSRAESSSAIFEHHRNDGAAEAARALEIAGFTVVERRDVSPTTSNQWLLRARR